jgi:predicted glycoside hydrolase/deacetylase ChbG (UPF0249 family)
MIEMAQSRFLSSISVLVERHLEEQYDQLVEITRLRTERQISLGLHLEITAGDGAAVFDRQWKIFDNLTGSVPDHIDVHKGHFHNVNFNAVGEFCLTKGVPFRRYEETTVQVASPAGTLTATYTDLANIEKWIHSLQGNLVYELVFHIGVFDPDSKSRLNQERGHDVEKLLLLQKFISDRGISIVNYRSLKSLR